MVVLVDLPDVVLLLILVKLPLWKIVQLARLCRRLNHLKNVCLKTRFTHLRLLGDSSVNKFVFDHEKADFFHITGDFDLVIRFENRKTSSSSNITLSEDWSVRNVDQLGRLAQLLPKISYLTVVVFRSSELPNFCASLLANWPNLRTLKLLNHRSNEAFIQHTLPAVNSLACLEHLQIDVGLNIEQPERAFAALFGRLKTFVTPECSTAEYITRNGRTIPAKPNRTVWSGEEAQELGCGLPTFGLSYQIEEPHLANRNLKYIQADLDFFVNGANKNNLAKWPPTDWTALQCVHLNFKCKKLNSSFKPIFAQLALLTNLTELHLNLYSRDFSEYLSLEGAKLPRFASVRQFRVKCLLEPHQLYLLANVFPNACELSLQLWATINISNDDRDSYFASRPHLSAHCVQCKQTMKRAIDKFGGNIASFHWFLEKSQQQRQDASDRELIPKVKLFTTKIAGRIRPNYRCISID